MTDALFERPSRLYAIGDTHGCNNELVQLLDKIAPYIREQDYLVFLGDYVDRGPDSKGVIDVVINLLKTRPNTYALIGNHEDMMLSGDYWLQNGGVETLKSYGVDVNDYYTIHGGNIKRCIPDDHWEFLNSLSYTFQVGRVVCVHASLHPDFPVDKQSEEGMIWDRSMDGYNGPYHDDVFVVRGHTPGYTIKLQSNQLNIDTACVFGGTLTCAVIDPESGDPLEYHQVKSGYSYN